MTTAVNAKNTPDNRRPRTSPRIVAVDVPLTPVRLAAADALVLLIGMIPFGVVAVTGCRQGAALELLW